MERTNYSLKDDDDDDDDDVDVRFAQDQLIEMEFSALTHKSNSPRGDISLDSDTIF